MLPRVLLLLALFGCAAALPSSPAHLRAPSPQALRLKGGWLNEKQMCNTITGLSGMNAVQSVFFPKETMKMYGIKEDLTPLERTSVEFFGCDECVMAILLGLHAVAGRPLNEALGVAILWATLFLAWQLFAKGGFADISGAPRGPLYSWLVSMGVSSLLFLTDGAGTGMDLTLLTKFWAVVLVLQSVFTTCFFEQFLRMYGIKETNSPVGRIPVGRTMALSKATQQASIGMYMWLVSEGKSHSAALLPGLTLWAIRFWKDVYTQEWRKLKASNGVGAAVWAVISTLLGYNACRLGRNLK